MKLIVTESPETVTDLPEAAVIGTLSFVLNPVVPLLAAIKKCCAAWASDKTPEPTKTLFAEPVDKVKEPPDTIWFL